jgi:hypothetical protein
MGFYINISVFFYFLGRSGAESTVTEDTKWPIAPAPDDG